MATEEQVELRAPRSGWDLPVVLLASFGVMVLWPLIGMALTYRMIDGASECLIPFCGVTAIFLLPVMHLTEVPGEVLEAVAVAVWFAVLVVPPIIMCRRPRSRKALVVLLALQSAFSFAQAAMGVLMIFGKGC